MVSSGEELALDEDGNDDLCPTESTTSRFEKAEKMVEAKERKEKLHIERYVTKEQLLVIERDLIKKRLPEILKDFNEVSARVSRSEGSLREESKESKSENSKSKVENLNEKEKSFHGKSKTSSTEGSPEIVDKNEPQTSNPSQEEKYTTSFESISSNTGKETSEAESVKTQRSPAKTLSHFSEHFSDENATMCSEEELSPDPSLCQNPPVELGNKDINEEKLVGRGLSDSTSSKKPLELQKGI